MPPSGSFLIASRTFRSWSTSEVARSCRRSGRRACASPVSEVDRVDVERLRVAVVEADERLRRDALADAERSRRARPCRASGRRSCRRRRRRGTGGSSRRRRCPAGRGRACWCSAQKYCRIGRVVSLGDRPGLVELADGRDPDVEHAVLRREPREALAVGADLHVRRARGCRTGRRAGSDPPSACRRRRPARVGACRGRGPARADRRGRAGSPPPAVGPGPDCGAALPPPQAASSERTSSFFMRFSSIRSDLDRRRGERLLDECAGGRTTRLEPCHHATRATRGDPGRWQRDAAVAGEPPRPPQAAPAARARRRDAARGGGAARGCALAGERRRGGDRGGAGRRRPRADRRPRSSCSPSRSGATPAPAIGLAAATLAAPRSRRGARASCPPTSTSPTRPALARVLERGARRGRARTT